MNGFEYAFSLLGLLLGFTLVEVLGGLVKVSKMWRMRTGTARAEARIGWLTPLLALFILLDIASYWDNVWSIRSWIDMGLDTIFAGLIIAGGYYYAASMIFPDDPERWPDLDEWFWLHRRQVMGPLLAINLAWVLIYSNLDTANSGSLWGFVVVWGIYFGGMLAALLSRWKWLIALALTANIALYLYYAIAQAIGRIA